MIPVCEQLETVCVLISLTLQLAMEAFKLRRTFLFRCRIVTPVRESNERL